MNSWPREIAEDEAIVRGILSPFHIKKGKLQPVAYNPPYDTDEVSVMRLAWIGADKCKYHAKKLEVPGQKIYQGLAVLSARQIQVLGASVVDSREEFEGHADIRHGIIPSKNDPLPPELLLVLRERVKMLANLANFFSDPDPAGPTWTGPPLRYR
jgi:hypothetical protein